MKRNPEGIAEAIGRAESIAVCSHVNPDGDTVGSALAMRLGLMALGRKVTVFCQDKIPDQLSFLPGVDTFRNPDDSEESYDLLLAVDVSDPERLGNGKQLLSKARHTAQIDHHPTNPMYAETNSVDGEAPAACILIHEQLKRLGVPITRDISMCLYTGISTDTGNFAFSATNAEAFEIMSDLMRTGLPLSELSRILFRERSREQLMLLGKAIRNMRFEGNGRIAVMTLSRRDFEDCGALNEHADTLVNFGLETIGTKMAVLAREDSDGSIKCSLRAKEPNRVDAAAKLLGGGGHPQASGVTLQGTLESALQQLLPVMTEKMNG